MAERLTKESAWKKLKKKNIWILLNWEKCSKLKYTLGIRRSKHSEWEYYYGSTEYQVLLLALKDL